MKKLLRRIIKSEVYTIIKDQSGLIIFLTTLFGSILALAMQVSNYFYSFGRFSEYDIPLSFIKIEAFSIYHVVEIFVSILCIFGGVYLLICIKATNKIGKFSAKLQFDLDNNKKQLRKTRRQLFWISFRYFLGVVLIDSPIVILSSPKSLYVGIILFSVLFIIQFIYCRLIIKEGQRKDTEDEESIKEENIEKLKNLGDEHIEKYIKESNKLEAYRKISKASIIFIPVVLIIMLTVTSCFSNYISGKSSTTKVALPYQIIAIDNEEYVVLEKIENNYILAKVGIEEKDDVLHIHTNSQMILPIENQKYRLEYFDRVVIKKEK